MSYSFDLRQLFPVLKQSTATGQLECKAAAPFCIRNIRASVDYEQYDCVDSSSSDDDQQTNNDVDDDDEITYTVHATAHLSIDDTQPQQNYFNSDDDEEEEEEQPKRVPAKLTIEVLHPKRVSIIIINGCILGGTNIIVF